MRGIRRAGLGLALAILGCQTAPPLRPLPEGDARPAALLERWTRSVADRSALRAEARLSVDSERGDGEPLRVRSRQRVVLARPARLRVEVQGMLGTTLAVLAVDDQQYAWFEAESRHYESGPVYDALLQRVVGLDLTPAEAVGVILGAPPLDPGLRVLGAWDAGGGVTRIALGEPGGDPRRVVDLDAEARLRRFAVLAPAKASRWVADFDEYALVAGSPFAERIAIETGDGARAVLSLSNVELNPPLAPDIFRLERPGGEGG